MFTSQLCFFTLLSFSQALRIPFTETDTLNSDIKTLKKYPRSLDLNYNNDEQQVIYFKQDYSNNLLGTHVRITKRETASSSEKSGDSESASLGYNTQERIPESKDEPVDLLQKKMINDVFSSTKNHRKKRRTKKLKKRKKQKKPKGGSKSKSGRGSSAGGCGGGILKPSCYSVDFETVAKNHPFDRVRPDMATKTDSCHIVTGVPPHLRTKTGGLLPPIHQKYVKYTEAYGIPIIGSSDVTDVGLRRACYIVKLMFASRYDIRNAYYKLHGRVALIGDRETTLSIPEYMNLDKKLDQSTRGIGPTIFIPVTSAGDDNMRCTLTDKYFNQDILIHELAHGIHQLAAKFVMPGFQKRLLKLYHQAMAAGKYTGKYAATNLNEYFAVGCQFYFNSYLGSEYADLSTPVRDRDSLRQYDCGLAALLDEIFPCAMIDENVPRCGWKECTSKSFDQKFKQEDGVKSGCHRLYTGYSQNTPDKCARLTCHFLGNAFNWKLIREQSTCIVMKCDVKNGNLDLNLTYVDRPFNIYTIKQLPVMDLKAESAHIAKMKQFCTKPLKDLKNQCKTLSDNKCGYAGINSADCGNIGCCWKGTSCYQPNNKCADHDFSFCGDLAAIGECTRNPGYMLVKCPLSCNICDAVKSAALAQTKIHCKDILQTCKKDASNGKCSLSNYRDRNCQLACRKCQIPSNWYSLVALTTTKFQQLKSDDQ